MLMGRQRNEIHRYLGQPLDIAVAWDTDPMVPYNLTYAAITDVSMCWKRDPAVDADDAYLQKTLGGGGVTKVDPTGEDPSLTLIMQIGTGDYTNVTPGTYQLVIAVNPGSGPWIELRTRDSPPIVVTTDAHRT